jgi:predicted nucleic acid-binding protein
MWQSEFLRPKDSIHVATAVRSKVDSMDTFDDALIKLSGKIGNPPLVIQRPLSQISSS